MEHINKIITIAEASTICGVSRATIWRWIKSGKIRAAKTAGGHHRISKVDLQAFIKNENMHIQFRDNDNKKILVVDDDHLIRKFFKRFLNFENLTLEFAKDGFDAGIKTNQFKPDLIILDLYMPNIDGFSICRQLKNEESSSSIKIIAISGYDTPTNRDRILSAGADVFLAKPIDSTAMLMQINQLLNCKLLKVG